MALEVIRAAIDDAGQASVDRVDVATAARGVPAASIGLAHDTDPSAALLALSLAAAAPLGAALCSRAVATALADAEELPAARLATLRPPEPVYVAAGAVTPPLALDSVDHDVPLRHATFVGRVAQIAAVAAAVVRGEVVTVTGPGGVGKTETALRAAAVAAPRLGATIRTVELASLGADDVAHALERAVASATSRPLLLVVDNAEHVTDPVRDWLAATDRSDVATLVTSRAPIGAGDERVIVLPLLEPDDAASLFADRAARAGGARGDDASVAALCAQLDHLPLAIELAAARSRLLSPAAITERLVDRFRVLPSVDDAGVAHHRSLDAAIAWSYDLLDDGDRAAFRRLGVFADRFDLAQAEHVGVGLDTLGRLVDQSLVAAEPEALHPYRLLESVRAFALEALRAGDEERAARDGLVTWLTDVTVPLDEGANAARDAVFHSLDDVPADVRRALEHVTETRPLDAVRLFGRLGAWFWDRGRVGEGVAVALTVVAADPGDDPLATARLLNALANLHVRAGDPVLAVPLYERTLALREANAAGAAQVASTHNDFGTCLLHLGHLDAAKEQLEHARTGYAAVDDRWGVATAATNLAALAVTGGELDGAAAEFARAAAEFRLMGDRAQAAAARTNEGLVYLELEDVRAAATLAAAARDVMRAGVRSILPHVLAGAATCALRAGDTERAAQLWGAARGIGHVEEQAELEKRIGDAVGWDRLDALAATGAAASDDTLLAWVDADPARPTAADAAELRRGANGWDVVFAGAAARLPAIKGVEYLARLLAAPGEEVHVADLAGVAVAQRGTELADGAALAAYRRRVTELRRMLDDADARGDVRAGVVAQTELDHLVAELARSTDRQGRVRVSGDDSERARKAVTNRIRDAVRAAADAHAGLGRHLEHAVKTGTYCQYAPEHPVDWVVET